MSGRASGEFVRPPNTAKGIPLLGPGFLFYEYWKNKKRIKRAKNFFTSE
jgi:hypothetical protein